MRYKLGLSNVAQYERSRPGGAGRLLMSAYGFKNSALSRFSEADFAFLFKTPGNYMTHAGPPRSVLHGSATVYLDFVYKNSRIEASTVHDAQDKDRWKNLTFAARLFDLGQPVEVTFTSPSKFELAINTKTDNLAFELP
ncbi:hypothetical protein EON81_25705 [bacterium]|nr:MAG: hypothetical protein EON81_25705 [bacterium]